MATPEPKRENLPAIGPKLRPVQQLVAQYLGRGYSVAQIARALYPHIVPNIKGSEKHKIKTARGRIRKWQKQAHFRDEVWQWSVAQVDLATPRILAGVVNKAAAGRVDAAKLALEITGRHAPNADVTPAAINIIFGDTPRPKTLAVEGKAVDPDEEVDDAEWEPA